VGFCGIDTFIMAPEMRSRIRKGIHLQIALHPGAWGRGFATQAVEALVRYALCNYGLEHILAFVFEPNERSHRLMLRCQFSEIEHLVSSKLVIYERRA
jgi:RimJ/RimL family protein N-acetyltransferase